MSDEVLVEQRDGTLLITINRPSARNAIDTAIRDGLVAAVQRLNADGDLRVGVLTGAGGIFCSGMDLKAFAKTGMPKAIDHFMRHGSPDKPPIAAVEGYALAGGLELALTCDLIVAAKKAKLGIPEAKVGLFDAGGGLLRLPQRLPINVAMEMAITAEPITARLYRGRSHRAPVVCQPTCGLGLSAEPEFARQWNRPAWRAAKARLRKVFATKTRDEWAEIFADADACVTPVLSLTEATQYRHNLARSVYEPDDNGAFQPAPAPRFSRTWPHAGDVRTERGGGVGGMTRAAGHPGTQLGTVLIAKTSADNGVRQSGDAATTNPARPFRRTQRGTFMTPDSAAAAENADFAGLPTAARASKNSPAGLDTLRDVARREFVAHGYHAVSIRDIAKESGSSLSVLYHYYGSKQELLYGVLNDAIDSFHATLESHAPDLAQNPDPVNRFAAVIQSLVVYRATRKLDSLLFIREFRNLEPKYAQLISRRRADVRELLDTVITDGVAAGVFKTPFPADARRTIVAMLNAIAEWYRQPGELTIEMLVARYTRLALAVVEYTGDLNTKPKASDSMLAQTTSTPETAG